MTLTIFLIAFSTIAVLVLLLQIVFVLYVRRYLRRSAKRAIEAAWTAVRGHNNGMLKVIEADKVFDEALKLLGYTGSLGEKLQKAGARFSNIESLWKAHKLRNSLVHDLRTPPEDREVDAAVESFRGALRELGASVE